MMKHEQVLVNLVELKLRYFEETGLPFFALDNKIIRQLIMDLETTCRNNAFITMERSYQGDLSL